MTFYVFFFWSKMAKHVKQYFLGESLSNPASSYHMIDPDTGNKYDVDFWTRALDGRTRKEDWIAFFEGRGYRAALDCPTNLFYEYAFLCLRIGRLFARLTRYHRRATIFSSLFRQRADGGVSQCKGHPHDKRPRVLVPVRLECGRLRHRRHQRVFCQSDPEALW